MVTRLRLFLLSFLILFLELALIRWIPAYIRPVGYFSNLILLGTFLGMGIGLLWSHSKKAWFPFFPAALLLLLGVVSLLRIDVVINSPSELFFQALNEDRLPAVNALIILPFIFIMVSVVFALISQEMGKVFALLKPLTAYSLDILGSLGGIGLFTLLASQNTSAWMWFAIVAAAGSLLLILRTSARVVTGIGILCLVTATGLSYREALNTIWSPYYKVTVTGYHNGYAVNVNNMGHQFMQKWQDDEPFYISLYNAFPNGKFRRILVIGAGTGNDVALALAKNPGVERIDAVEIDPVILSLGQELHPDHPYDNPKVHVIVDDGRNFLERSRDKYDLIVFALTDSLTLTSQMSSVRLESFLYTLESFQTAKNHLTDDGVFVLYNYYREQWLVDKLTGMLIQTFQMPVYVKFYGDIGWAATLIAGPKTAELTHSTVVFPYAPQSYVTPASDDWPFIYLQTKSIPPLYLELIGILFAVSAAAILPTLRKQKNEHFDLRFFLFGAAFLLLETKRIVTFELLFGATWMVNAQVFAAILISVLTANLMSERHKFRPIWALYLTLFISLAVSVEIPKAWLLTIPRTTRYIIASIIYFSPIFFANLIFSQLFRHTKNSVAALGSNLLGAVLGGLVEYVSLAIGYWNLNIVVALFYFIAMFVV